MDMNTILTYGIGIVFIISVGAYFVVKYKNTPTLTEFLDSLKDAIKTEIVNSITNFDVSKITDKDELAKAETEFFQNLYTDIWNIAWAQIETLKASNIIAYTILKKTITREKLQSYVDVILNDENTQSKLTDIYNTAMSAHNKAIEEEDAKLAAEQDIIDNGEVEPDSDKVPDYDPKAVDGIPDVSSLVPQTDEEAPISSTDDFVELVDTADIGKDL